jgi:hypothetical protein
MSANYQGKITALWTVFLLGTIFHTDLGLMPLFHGLEVAESVKAQNIDEISWVLWGMLIFFTLPMLAIVGTAFTNLRRFRAIHFGMTVIYSILNLGHLAADLLLPKIVWPQIALMLFLFLIGLLLNLVSFQWWRDRSHKQLREQVSS